MLEEPIHNYSPLNIGIDDLTALAEDGLQLFSLNKQGHMEKWEYLTSVYQGDPAGGSDHWAHLIKFPGNYYPTIAERNLIHSILDTDIRSIFLSTRTLVEFGPGSLDSIQNKTQPFITMCENLSQYIAIDSSDDQASNACAFIHRELGLKTHSIKNDFTRDILYRTWEGPTTYVMWGCTIGNLPGRAGQNPYPALVAEIRQIQKTFLKGDMLVLIFDRNDHEKTILNAYNEPALKQQSLSWLYALKRDGLATGDFDPRVWVHEPVWFPDVMQCAHTVFPMFDQTVKIGRHTIKIPAWRRFVSNNSYKFRASVMIAAAQDAGLKAQVIQHGPMAMLIAEK